ncbi:MAG TPA: hypothetical protein VFE82_18795 [Ramlibacter sp.]|jgi:hypothetical protein|uniref:hypothetical protein n=1 Tax=Ramlibacter sp. TaxID=1917967 RepID=UPI002D6BC75D|nr:hypothetical protein [Ramlibacter sp.]HZY20525.1 hypothetical protein [Ramlibacter sp.]
MPPIQPSSGAPAGLPPASAFGEAAQRAPEVRVSVDGQEYRVLAQGQLSGEKGARSVAWIQGDVDTTSVFVQALQQSYGGALSTAVARELGLDPAPGKPLASRLVQQALDMGQTGQKALAGVDFLTFIEHSATTGGGAYRRLLADAGIDPKSVSPAHKQQIDDGLRAQFAAAAAAGASPVPASTASDWLRSRISGLTDQLG